MASRKYIWMAVSIAVVWVVVVLVNIFGPTFVVENVGEAYGLEMETQSLGWPVGYFALITTAFILLPVPREEKKGSISRRRYIWVCLSILAVWLVVLIVAILDITYEVAAVAASAESSVASGMTESHPVAIPLAVGATGITALLAKFVVDFGLGEGLRRQKELLSDSYGSFEGMGGMM